MKFIFIFILVLVIAYFVRKYTRYKKRAVEQSIPVREDRAPFTADSVIRIDKEGVYKITHRSLIFGDKDGDKIHSFRFYDFTETLFLDKDLSIPYNPMQELPFEFELFTVVQKNKDFSTKYDVQSNNKWSD